MLLLRGFSHTCATGASLNIPSNVPRHFFYMTGNVTPVTGKPVKLRMMLFTEAYWLTMMPTSALPRKPVGGRILTDRLNSHTVRQKATERGAHSTRVFSTIGVTPSHYHSPQRN
jgi:hypothetical protein